MNIGWKFAARRSIATVERLQRRQLSELKKMPGTYFSGTSEMLAETIAPKSGLPIQARSRPETSGTSRCSIDCQLRRHSAYSSSLGSVFHGSCCILLVWPDRLTTKIRRRRFSCNYWRQRSMPHVPDLVFIRISISAGMGERCRDKTITKLQARAGRRSSQA